jgi:hypothetical protein
MSVLITRVPSMVNDLCPPTDQIARGPQTGQSKGYGFV